MHEAFRSSMVDLPGKKEKKKKPNLLFTFKKSLIIKLNIKCMF